MRKDKCEDCGREFKARFTGSLPELCLRCRTAYNKRVAEMMRERSNIMEHVEAAICISDAVLPRHREEIFLRGFMNIFFPEKSPEFVNKMIWNNPKYDRS